MELVEGFSVQSIPSELASSLLLINKDILNKALVPKLGRGCTSWRRTKRQAQEHGQEKRILLGHNTNTIQCHWTEKYHWKKQTKQTKKPFLSIS